MPYRYSGCKLAFGACICRFDCSFTTILALWVILNDFSAKLDIPVYHHNHDRQYRISLSHVVCTPSWLVLLGTLFQLTTMLLGIVLENVETNSQLFVVRGDVAAYLHTRLSM